jgi:hypothetical protein
VVALVFKGGQPVAGARAVVTREGGDSSLEAEDADRVLKDLFKGEGVSDSEGRIDLGRFPPGTYRVEVTWGEAVQHQSFTLRPGDPSGRMQSDLELGFNLR